MSLKDKEDIEGNDEYIINMWLSQTKRGDHVYVLGDMILSNQEDSKKILHKLKSNGCKIHLIVGNHDKSTYHLYNMFETIDFIKIMNFSKKEFPFIEEDYFQVFMCHYPTMSWWNKCRGCVHLYGHVHNNSPWLNDTRELMVNVGLDSQLSNYKLISLEKLYRHIKNKLNGLSYKEYIDKLTVEDEKFIR